MHTVLLETEKAYRPELPAIAALFEGLNRRSVRYCQWKSSLKLDAVLQGKGSLDLLVDRKHRQLFQQVLHEKRLKPVLPPSGARQIAVEHWLGLDGASGKLFSVRVRYQLAVGDHFVKNYHLPLEDFLLDSVALRKGLKVPEAEWEIIVRCGRSLLKYRVRDFVKDLLSIRGSGLPAYTLDEIAQLVMRTTIERIRQRAERVVHIVPGAVVLEFLDTVRRNPRAGWKLFRLRRALRRALRPYQRQPRLSATFRYFREAWRRRKSFLRFSSAPKMTLPHGGFSLALIGADGAGKSTLCQALRHWLGVKLEVESFYLGSKQPSRRSRLAYLVFRIARRSHRTVANQLGEAHGLARLLGRLRDLLLAAHHLSVGHDRYRRYLAGRRKAAAGAVVLYDRYPLQSISDGAELRLLDGPQIPLLPSDHQGAWHQALARAAQNLYRGMLPPDALFVLEASPAVCWQRKPGHKLTALEAKSRVVNSLPRTAWGGEGEPRWMRINAERPLKEVLGQLKSHIWEVL